MVLFDILPQAIAWAEAQCLLAIRVGRPLDAHQCCLASAVGVAYPERVRVLEVGAIPLPTEPGLRQAAGQLGLLGHGAVGITLGYAILVLQGRLTLSVLAHELRHVAQFEQSGSITAFLEEYLRQVFEYGYRDAPLEVEARGYEGAANADSTVN